MLTPLILFLWLAAVFIVSFCTTYFLKTYLAHKDVLDVPNHRSSHKKPIPRGGGLAVLFAVVPSLVLYAHLSPLGQTKPLLMLVGGVILLGVLGWSDDTEGVSPKVRLCAHFILCALAVGGFKGQQVFPDILPYHLEKAFIVIGWVWFINLYNFMDGIDGITVVETASIALGSAVVLFVAGYSYSSLIPYLSVFSAILAFGYFNWAPAKLFLGDVGSVPLGFMMAWLLILLAYSGFVEAAIILPMYYVFDSGYTLFSRLRHRENVFQGHRQHFYQKAVDGGRGHSYVSSQILLCNIVLICLAILSLFIMSGISFVLSVIFVLLFVHKILCSHVKV